MTSVTDGCRSYGHDRLAGVRGCLSEDIRRYLTRSPADLAWGDNLKRRLSAFLTPELQGLLLYRMAHYCSVRGWRRLAEGLTDLNRLFHKVTITPESCIGPGCRLSHPAGVTFHGTAGWHLTLFSLAVCTPTVTGMRRPREDGPRLGDRVTVGAHAAVIGPVTVGDDTKIAFSVRLDKDAPPDVLVVSRAQFVRAIPRKGSGATPDTPGSAGKDDGECGSPL